MQAFGADILDEQGDEIISNADSIVIEICVDKEIVKRVFKLAKKHGGPTLSLVVCLCSKFRQHTLLMLYLDGLTRFMEHSYPTQPIY